jgi:exosome complex RNA-binding protein Rrp42 (RNase PH superfamily)
MLPSVEVDDEGIVTLSAAQSPVPLVVSRRPRCFTFGCIDQYVIMYGCLPVTCS